MHAKNGKTYNIQSARAAGLRYIADAAGGIRRQPAGKRFRYVHADGSPVRERDTLARIRALAIPPAWRDVWISPHADGHLQASGRDARGRKQYRYHRRWREMRDETKYGRMATFAKALPRIRRRVQHDLSRPGLPREKVLATVVRLLETTLIRVGNEEYARENDSFGLTTLRGRQVSVRGERLKFRFRGKSGVHHDIELADPRVATIVRRMQELPGEELIQYIDDGGERRRIESADVNGYLKDITGEEFTSKDFRTWAGTVLAARALRALQGVASQGTARRDLNQAIESVAKQLGNTKAVCRKCYIHPAVIDAYVDGSLWQQLPGRSDEAVVLGLVKPRRRGSGERSLVPLLRRSLTARGLRRSAQPPSKGASP